jgi:hypothetical protein
VFGFFLLSVGSVLLSGGYFMYCFEYGVVDVVDDRLVSFVVAAAC